MKDILVTGKRVKVSHQLCYVPRLYSSFMGLIYRRKYFLMWTLVLEPPKRWSWDWWGKNHWELARVRKLYPLINTYTHIRKLECQKGLEHLENIHADERREGTKCYILYFRRPALSIVDFFNAILTWFKFAIRSVVVFFLSRFANKFFRLLCLS